MCIYIYLSRIYVLMQKCQRAQIAREKSTIILIINDETYSCVFIRKFAVGSKREIVRVCVCFIGEQV